MLDWIAAFWMGVVEISALAGRVYPSMSLYDLPELAGPRSWVYSRLAEPRNAVISYQGLRLLLDWLQDNQNHHAEAV